MGKRTRRTPELRRYPNIVTTRVDDATLEKIDQLAKATQNHRAAVIRRLIEDALLQAIYRGSDAQ